MKYIRILITLLLATVIGIFISAPSKYMQSFWDGLTVWAYNVLPALFPFTVLMNIALKLKPKSSISVTGKLFGISCDQLWIMSILCGYPIGARCIADSDADCSTATKACSFCSTAGPIFIIATIGAKLLHSGMATAILVITHFASCVCNGLLYRSNKRVKILETSEGFKPEDIGKIVTDAALSIISVGGLIALFYMLTDMLKSFLPASLSNSLVIAFATGILEMTNGIFAVCKVAEMSTAIVLCSALLSLGGICVFFQNYAFLGKKKVNPIKIIFMKLTQSALATIISYILVRILL